MFKASKLTGSYTAKPPMLSIRKLYSNKSGTSVIHTIKTCVRFIATASTTIKRLSLTVHCLSIPEHVHSDIVCADFARATPGTLLVCNMNMNPELSLCLRIFVA